MGSHTKDAYGAVTRGDLLYFDPEFVVLVEDKESDIYDERVHSKLDEEMIDNVDKYGIHEPVEVRRAGDRDPTEEDIAAERVNPATKKVPIIEVVDGRHRTRWLREANKRRAKRGDEPHLLPAIPKGSRRGEKLSAAEWFELVVTSNLRAAEDTPIVKARKLARYMELEKADGTKPSFEDACRMFAISESTGRNWQALVSLAPSVQKAFETQELSVKLARDLAKLEPEDQKKQLEEMREKGATKGTAAQTAMLAKRTGRSVKKTKDPDKNGGGTKAIGKPMLVLMYNQISEMDTSEFTAAARAEYHVAYELLALIVGEKKRLIGPILGELSRAVAESKRRKLKE